MAKTLGSLMRFKKTRREWLNVLESKIWELEEVEQKVFQPLLLSYYDLTSVTKRCLLLYCGVFPKYYEFDKDNLIDMWMSQDYLGSSENKKIDKGQKYSDSLVMRSFFQDFKKDRWASIRSCKMHDIIHDFVQFLTKNCCYIMVDSNGNKGGRGNINPL